MTVVFERLRALLGEIHDLERMQYLLEWDARTYMPDGGAEGRAMQLSTVTRLMHEKLVSEELGEIFEQAEAAAAGLEPDSDEARIVMRLTHKLAQKRRVPAEWVAEKSRTTALAHQAWRKARAEADFPYFEPHLEKVVALYRQYSEFFQPYEHVYDPLLDEYEIGMKTAKVREVFETLRPRQIELVRAIGEREQVDDSAIHQPFDEGKQWEFGLMVIEQLGYDFTRGRQDKSTHPFTIDFGIDDVRITTRVDPHFFNPAFFATLHEAGHAIYDQGIDPSLQRTLVAEGTSLGIHESQSRMYENLIGRSRPFWRHYYPKLQAVFPQQLGEVPLETFYRAINKVVPSYIRVEADEATYNLHIMLRFELELALMDGDLQVADLPAAWNEKMQAYLGLTPPNDAQGVLQDIHWSEGYIGYFSTYTLGNLIACQLWQAMAAAIPDLTEQIEQGQFEGTLEWLRHNVHRHGAKLLPGEIVERATGSELSAEPYLAYLQTKFGEIYSL